MRSNSYIVLGASVGTTGTRWLMLLGLFAVVVDVVDAVVVVVVFAAVDDGGAVDGGVNFAGGGSGGVTGVETSIFVFVVGGTVGNELLPSSATTAAGTGGTTDTGTGDREVAAIFFSISRTSCATLVRSRRSESSYSKKVYT